MSTPSPAQSDEESPMATIYPFPVRTGHIEVQSEPEPQSEVVEAEIVGGPETPGTELAIPARPVLQRYADARRVPLVLKPARLVPEVKSARRTLFLGLLRFVFRSMPWATVLGLHKTFVDAFWWGFVWDRARVVELKANGKWHAKGREVRKDRWARIRYLIYYGTPALIGSALLFWFFVPGKWQIATVLGFMLLMFGVGYERPRRETISGFRTSTLGSVADFKAAFIAAGLMKEEDPLIPLEAPHRDGEGVYTELGLKPGLTVAKINARRAEIASGLSVNSALMEVSKGKLGDAHVCIWCPVGDPFAGGSKPFPLLGAKEHDAWSGGPLGFDVRGRKIDVNMLWASMLVGGQQGSGKTYSMITMAAPYALDPRVQLLVFDGKGGVDWDPLELIAHRFASGFDDETCLVVLDGLKELLADAQRRGKELKRLRAAQDPRARAGKLTPQLSRDPKLRMPLTLVVIDEIQNYLECKAVSYKVGSRVVTVGQDIREQVEKLIKIGRYLGIIILAGTQRPSHRVLPTDIRSMFGARFGLQLMDPTSSDMILGEGMASAGYDCSELEKEYLGVGILVPNAETKMGVKGNPTVQTYYLDPDVWIELCEKAHEARSALGLLTGYAAGERPETHDGPIEHVDEVDDVEPVSSKLPPLLARIVDYVSDETRERVGTEELIEELGLDMGSRALVAKFKEWGFETGRNGRRCPMGPLVSDIQEAAARLG